MSKCKYCDGDCPNQEEYICDGYSGDIDNLYEEKTMSKWWYLCGRSGIIKYAGEFENYDDAEEGIREVNLDWVWIFDGKPEIEKEI